MIEKINPPDVIHQGGFLMARSYQFLQQLPYSN